MVALNVEACRRGILRVVGIGVALLSATVAVGDEGPLVPIPPAEELLQPGEAADEPENGKSDPREGEIERNPTVGPEEIDRIAEDSDAGNADPGAENPPEDEVEAKGGEDFEWGFKIRPDQPNLFLNLNGYAWHLNKGDESEEEVNDWPFGLGLTYELRRKKNYIWTVDGDLFFVDSNNDFAAAAGSTILWRTKIVDIGARGGLLYKQNFVDDWGFPLGPVLLPVLQRDFGYFSVKVVYIPPVRKATDEQFFIQLLIPLGGPAEKK